MIERRTVTPATFEGAYQCARDGTCPQRSGEKGCPKWWECSGEETDATGRVRQVIIAGCMDDQRIMGAYLEGAWNNSLANSQAGADMREQILNRIGIVVANNLHRISPEALATALEHQRKEHDGTPDPAAH